MFDPEPIVLKINSTHENLKKLFDAYAVDREQIMNMLSTILARLTSLENDMQAVLMELDTLEMDRPLNVELLPPKKRAAKTRKNKR